jgi:hypothetical protein
MQKLFPLSGHFPSVWARRLIFFCLLPLSRVCARHFSVRSLLVCAHKFFLLSGHFHSLRARRIFYLVTVWSQLACKCQGAMQYQLCSSVHARTGFFCGVRSTAGVHGESFFCPVTSLLDAQNFSFAQFFFLLPSGLICADTWF